MKFTVHEKQVKAAQGAAYDLSKYTEGVDYRRQKTGFGSRVVFRADILGSSDAQVALKSDLSEQEVVITVVDPSLVEHKQDKVAVIMFQEDAQTVIVRSKVLDGVVRSARVTKKYANQRYVETDTLGTVFVGEKGHQVKMSQIINVKNGELYLKRT